MLHRLAKESQMEVEQEIDEDTDENIDKLIDSSDSFNENNDYSDSEDELLLNFHVPQKMKFMQEKHV